MQSRELPSRVGFEMRSVGRAGRPGGQARREEPGASWAAAGRRHGGRVVTWCPDQCSVGGQRRGQFKGPGAQVDVVRRQAEPRPQALGCLDSDGGGAVFAERSAWAGGRDRSGARDAEGQPPAGVPEQLGWCPAKEGTRGTGDGFQRRLDGLKIREGWGGAGGGGQVLFVYQKHRLAPSPAPCVQIPSLLLMNCDLE